jgi:hypothetical protein
VESSKESHLLQAWRICSLIGKVTLFHVLSKSWLIVLNMFNGEYWYWICIATLLGFSFLFNFSFRCSTDIFKS